MNPLVRQMMEDNWTDKTREPLHQLHHWAQQQQPQPPMVLTPLQQPPQPQNPPLSDPPSQPPPPLATIVEPPEASIQPPSIQPPPEAPVLPVKEMKDSEVYHPFHTPYYPFHTPYYPTYYHTLFHPIYYHTSHIHMQYTSKHFTYTISPLLSRLIYTLALPVNPLISIATSTLIIIILFLRLHVVRAYTNHSFISTPPHPLFFSLFRCKPTLWSPYPHPPPPPLPRSKKKRKRRGQKRRRRRRMLSSKPRKS